MTAEKNKNSFYEAEASLSFWGPTENYNIMSHIVSAAVTTLTFDYKKTFFKN